MNKSSTAFRATVFVLCLWAPMLAQAQAALTAPGKPSWTSALSQSTDTGKFQLNWKPATGDEVDIYRLTEVFEGSEHTAYLEGTAQEFFRGEPGVFTFKLEACRREPFGVPVCSAKSKNLQVTVTEEIWAPYMQDKPVAPIAQLAVPGGPDELKPGSWFNPAKNGQGWGLYWANRLV